MDNFTNNLEKFGSNFLVAAMIPSLGLVVACLVVFDPILHVSDSFQSDNGIYPLLGIGLLVGIPTIIFGYTLTALNTFMLKFFEGYVFFHRFSFLKNSQAKRANFLLKRREELKREIKTLELKKNRSPEDENLLNEFKTMYYTETATYDHLYPPTNTEIMPTKFGNILKASEAYSGTRYGIDAVQFWPRLWHVIPESYRQTINEARNELSFLVNISALSTLFYILCLIAVLTNVPSPDNPNWDAMLANQFRYVIAGILGLVSNWFFNKAALFSVGEFGTMIRSAYDLFRLDLLEKLRLKHPKDSVEEFQVWKNLGELIVLGQESLDFKPIEYEIKKSKK